MKLMNRIALILFLVCGIIGVAMPILAQETQAPAAAAPAVSTPAPAGEEETDIVAGKVTAVDAVNNALTVRDEANKTFTVTATKEETSIWKGDNTVELPEVNVDDSVELEYYKAKDGKLVAIWIDILAKETSMPKEATPAETAPVAPAPAPAQ